MEKSPNRLLAHTISNLSSSHGAEVEEMSQIVTISPGVRWSQRLHQGENNKHAEGLYPDSMFPFTAVIRITIASEILDTRMLAKKSKLQHQCMMALATREPCAYNLWGRKQRVNSRMRTVDK
ncbi:hypothetical protein ACMFMG_003199 [Clarireedia jacksonii]